MIKSYNIPENCLWMMMADSGNNAHSGFVSAVTFISALLSAILFVLAAMFYRYH